VGGAVEVEVSSPDRCNSGGDFTLAGGVINFEQNTSLKHTAGKCS